MPREAVRTVNAFWQMTDSSGEINWRLRISDMFWGQNIKRNVLKVALKLQLCVCRETCRTNYLTPPQGEMYL